MNTPAETNPESNNNPTNGQDATVHHELRSRRKRVHTIKELNLTSFLDVTFQLLIFFVLTASFVVGEGILPADLPSGRAPVSTDDPEPPSQPIIITLRSLGADEVSIQLEGLATPPVDFNELFLKLAGLQNGPSQPTAPFNADDPVIIQPDPNVPWNHVVNAFNAAIRAKYSNVNFAQPQQSPAPPNPSS